jgi:superfamily II DNA/RNA helicase
MQMNSNQFGQTLALPDSWQRRALNFLREGNDVVLHAPTGAGKTFVFEQLIESGWKGKAVYTVPTRALANDKFRDWKERGWDVGLITGDIRYQPDASIVVATLETQRGSIAKGVSPDLFVVDEYQLLGDQRRGPGYEVTIALTPSRTRLLLMSGSVANPLEVADWLRGIGRQVELVSEGKRPVPLDEVFAETLLRRPFRGRKVRGHWPKLVAGALSANLGPLLIFAPRRAVAEDLARQLAAELPPVETLELSQEQKKVAGKELLSLLKRRIAYHHSGLDYSKRAGVIEPLAKAGQLQVVVATTGLGAGVNFSMRSVLVTDREYRVDDELGLLRADELLQMFGRAGRRGMDDRGYVIVAPRQARMSEARPLKLHRSKTLDWAALIRSMAAAVRKNKNPIEAARWLAMRLFSEERVRLGLDLSLGDLPNREDEIDQDDKDERDEVVEMRNSVGLWERRSGQSKSKLANALVLSKGEWVNPLTIADTLGKVNIGNPCRFGSKKDRVYGRELSLGMYQEDEPGKQPKIVLIKSFRKRLREVTAEENPRLRKKFSRKVWRRHGLEEVFREILPLVSQGGELVELVDRGKVLRARLSYENAVVLGWKDARGKVLLNPPMRRVQRVYDSPFRSQDKVSSHDLNNLSPSEVWYELGLIDQDARPTVRGEIFSFFSRGEGLAIAAAIEDEKYPLDELITDLVNLRAGHRFRGYASSESRLAMVCRETYGLRDCQGYLKGGLPEEYGEGAMEVLQNRQKFLQEIKESSDLHSGDIERVEIEWKSLLSLIAYAPVLPLARWQELQQLAKQVVGENDAGENLPELPELLSRQKERFESNSGPVT